jgi:predicted CXXCH cytochrome family protein
LRDPSLLNQKVRLDHNNQMQCTSCHDPHNNEFGKFLVKANAQSALCIECHSMTSWQTSVHKTSPKTWNGSGPNPFPNITASSVSAAACESCHAPHNAGTKQRLLTQATEELTCNVCHNGNLAEKNMDSEFRKASVHPFCPRPPFTIRRRMCSIHRVTSRALIATIHMR